MTAGGAQTKLGLVIHGGTMRTVVTAAQRAEAAGFGSVWTTEFYDRSATVTLAAIASATERIRLGSAIMYAVGRSPLVLAIEASDLAQLSGGRFTLGLGMGTKQMQAGWHGADPSSPAPKVEELVPLLRRIWSMGPAGVQHEGRFYRLDLVPTGLQNQASSVQVQLAAVNPRMITAVGRVGDGLIGHPLFTRRYVAEVVKPTLLAAAEEAGRPRPRLTGYVMCAISSDPEQARLDAKAQIAFYSIVRTYAPIMELDGFEAEAASAQEAWKRGDREGMIAAISDRMCDAIAVAGTPDEVAERLGEVAARYDEALLYSPSFGLPEERLRDNLDAIVDTFATSGTTAGDPTLTASLAESGR